MEQGSPSMPTPEQEPKVLSFEEFVFCDPEVFSVPKYNNFYMHFIGEGIFGDIYKNTPHYKRFVLKHPDMAKSLNDKVQNKDNSKGTKESLEPFMNELYEAYKIMRSYGASDSDLFT